MVKSSTRLRPTKPRAWRAALRDRGGASALEFAMVAPVFVLMLCGIMAYGGYFWIAHAVQQVANDAARVAIGGLTTSERASLAQGVLSNEIGAYAMLTPSRAQVAVQEQNQAIRVSITYDASNTPFWTLYQLLPMPSSTVVRTATVQLGGY